VGSTLGLMIGLDAAVYFIGSSFGGKAQWWAPVLGSLVGIVVGSPLLFLIGPFAAFVPIITTVVAYQWAHSEVIKPPEVIAPPSKPAQSSSQWTPTPIAVSFAF
jgi:hypothetical protein